MKEIILSFIFVISFMAVGQQDINNPLTVVATEAEIVRSNMFNFEVTGNCHLETSLILININGLEFSTKCSELEEPKGRNIGGWSIDSLDLSPLADGQVNICAYPLNSLNEEIAEEACITVLKTTI